MKPTVIIEPPMTEVQAAAWVTPEEIITAQNFTPARRREFLTWRAIVRRELGPDIQITYNAIGAPVLAGTDAFVGVSHCAGRVAVCLSDAPCSIDIEPLSRNFGRAVPRYMSPVERQLSDDDRLPAAVWCAKETLYKYAARTGLDLLSDLHIEAVDFTAGFVTGRIREEAPLQMSLRIEAGFLTVYII